MSNVSMIITVAEGRFVFLPGNTVGRPTLHQNEKPIAGRFVFQRQRKDGTYDHTPCKPPGRLTWRRKVRAKQAMRGGI
jgi:hypothetical protein